MQCSATAAGPAVIAEPANDRECLYRISQVAVAGLSRRDIRELAARFRSTAELVRWIRKLPQRDDNGAPGDGPTTACDVPQRTRIAPPDPNCVERSLLYLLLAELIDPGPVRQLMTITMKNGGRHTLPIEDGEPVFLDPSLGLTRNAVAACLACAHDEPRNAGGVARTSPREMLAWLVKLAIEPAAAQDGERGVARVEAAYQSLGRVLTGEAVSRGERRALGYVLDLAEREAEHFGPAAVAAAAVARRGVAALLLEASARRRNLRLPGISTRTLKRIGSGGVDVARVAGYGAAAYFGGPQGALAYHQVIGPPKSLQKQTAGLPSLLQAVSAVSKR
jgi:hypothetical protein